MENLDNSFEIGSNVITFENGSNLIIGTADPTQINQDAPDGLALFFDITTGSIYLKSSGKWSSILGAFYDGGGAFAVYSAEQQFDGGSAFSA